jgi:hypothetical protein
MPAKTLQKRKTDAMPSPPVADPQEWSVIRKYVRSLAELPWSKPTRNALLASVGHTHGPGKPKPREWHVIKKHFRSLLELPWKKETREAFMWVITSTGHTHGPSKPKPKPTPVAASGIITSTSHTQGASKS